MSEADELDEQADGEYEGLGDQADGQSDERDTHAAVEPTADEVVEPQPKKRKPGQRGKGIEGVTKDKRGKMTAGWEALKDMEILSFSGCGPEPVLHYPILGSGPRNLNLNALFWRS